jgi:hypothetical protein
MNGDRCLCEHWACFGRTGRWGIDTDLLCASRAIVAWRGTDEGERKPYLEV